MNGKLLDKFFKLFGVETYQPDKKIIEQMIINYVDHKMKGKPPGHIVNHPFNPGEYFIRERRHD